MMSFLFDSDDQQEAFGVLLGQLCDVACVIYLKGDLGAGKTTLARGFLRGMGHQGTVKSPTYAIVEPYEHLDIPCYHFDLYRLSDPEELEFLGLRDMLSGLSILLFEWPEKGQEELPVADVVITIIHKQDARCVQIEMKSGVGHTLGNKLKLKL